MGAVRPGAVHVIYGDPDGLSAARNQLWDQDSLGIPDTNENGEIFGFTLSAGDFDGDGAEDLVTANPFEDVGGWTGRAR
jgi:hypothetical protein